MSQAAILVDSSATIASLADANVIPVLVGATTGDGTAIAAQIPLSQLATFFESADAPVHITASNDNAFSVGRQGTTNPAFNVDTNASSSVTGVNVVAAAATARVALVATSSETNEGLDLDAKGSGTVRINVATATGSVLIGAGLTVSNAAGVTLTGGAGNMTVVAGTGNSRTMTLRATTSGGVAATFATGTDTTFNIPTGVELQTVGARVGYNVSAYGVGSAYAFTDTAAAINLGTTDPAIVLDKAGTYLIYGQVNLAYTGATVATETATIKVRRTNNTAADLSAVVVLDLPVSTVLTHTYGIFQIPPFVYTTSAVDDAVTLFGNVSAALGAGTIDATAIGTSIVAVRLY